MSSVSPGTTGISRKRGRSVFWMHRVLLAIVGTLALATMCAGCGGESEPTRSVAATSTSETIDACNEKTRGGIDALRTFLDRVDSDPDAAVEGTDAVGEILVAVFTDVGAACGRGRVGEAVSRVITAMASDASSRSGYGSSAAEGIVDEMCTEAKSDPATFPLSAQAQVACAASG